MSLHSWVPLGVFQGVRPKIVSLPTAPPTGVTLLAGGVDLSKVATQMMAHLLVSGWGHKQNVAEARSACQALIVIADRWHVPWIRGDHFNKRCVLGMCSASLGYPFPPPGIVV